jgi:hypothetical protein
MAMASQSTGKGSGETANPSPFTENQARSLETGERGAPVSILPVSSKDRYRTKYWTRQIKKDFKNEKKE